MGAGFFVEPLVEDGVQFSGVDGFGEVVIHACAEAVFAVAVHGVGGHGDDGDGGWGGGRGVGGGADCPGGFESIHDGHLAVHEDEVIGGIAEHFEGFLAVRGDIGLVAESGESFGGDDLVGGVVFDDEEPLVFYRVGGGRLGWGSGGWFGCGWGGGVADGFEESGAADGFSDTVFEPGFEEAGAVAVEHEGGEEEEAGGLDGGVGFDVLGERFSVHAGHFVVDEGDIEGLVILGGLAEGAEGGWAVDGFFEVGSDGAEGGGEEESICIEVIDDEDTEGLCGFVDCWGMGFGFGVLFELCGEPEGGALAVLAFDADGTVHHFGELF
ncbi:MAG: hypothetical protein RI897_776 [Verrucomicrobiota bacterium]